MTAARRKLKSKNVKCKIVEAASPKLTFYELTLQGAFLDFCILIFDFPKETELGLQTRSFN